jgi:hypothetical protein
LTVFLHTLNVPVTRKKADKTMFVQKNGVNISRSLKQPKSDFLNVLLALLDNLFEVLIKFFETSAPALGNNSLRALLAWDYSVFIQFISFKYKVIAK